MTNTHTPLATVLAARFPLLASSLKSAASPSPATRNHDGASVNGLASRPVPSGAPAGLKPAEQTAWLAYAERRSAASPGLDLFFAERFSDGCQVSAGQLEIWARPLGASPATLTAEDGCFVYRNAYPSTDVLHTVAKDRSEEFLHLATPSAPTRFDYILHSPSGPLQIESRDGGGLNLADANGHEVEIEAPWVVDANGHKSSAATRWDVGPLQPDGTRVITLHLSPEGLEYPLVIDPTWSATGTLKTARAFHTATLLQNGLVLVTGGEISGAQVTATCELYNPIAGTWTATGSMSTIRIYHTATLLKDGTVLVTGGANTIFDTPTTYSSCELYNPATGTWTSTGTMIRKRASHSAVLLNDGTVLVSGGMDESTSPTSYHSSCEVFSPGFMTWSSAGSLSSGRYAHASFLLSTGKVLVFGGGQPGANINTCALYDPASASWSSTGPLTTARSEFAAVALPSGNILVIGGANNGSALSSCEVYDVASGAWSAAGSLATARSHHAAAVLAGSGVIALGGYTTISSYLASSEVYDLETKTWRAGPALPAATWDLSATSLTSGLVLAAGGHSGNTCTANSELYNPSSGVWTSTGSLAKGRTWPTGTKLTDGKVLVAGGYGQFDPSGDYTSHTSCQLYDSTAGTWTNTGSLQVGRFEHTATRLANGQVLLAGGVAGGGFTSDCELYNPASGAWTTTGAMSAGRARYAAILLSDGKVLAIGGSPALSTCELYDPSTGKWTPTGSLATGRRMHRATLLPDGKVLVTGGAQVDGADNAIPLASCEIYDPEAGTWSEAASMLHSRLLHTAVLLPSGHVLTIGGWGVEGLHQACDRYDPGTNTWSMFARLNTPRYIHQTQLLDTSSDRVLVFGGQDSAAAGINTAELYDPKIGQWLYTLNAMPAYFNMFASSLLDNGQILAIAGDNNGTATTSVECALCSFS